MTAVDDARRRHPSSGAPTPTPVAVGVRDHRRRAYVMASTACATLIVLSVWWPQAAVLLAGWVVISCAAVGLWIGLCEVSRWWVRRRRAVFDAHTDQALHVVGDDQ